MNGTQQFALPKAGKHKRGKLRKAAYKRPLHDPKGRVVGYLDGYDNPVVVGRRLSGIGE